MLNGPNGGKSNSLMGEYSSLLGEAVLRDRARVAESSAQIEADLASKVKSEFISNMSHELRTPLNTIIGFSNLMRDHETRPLQNNEITEYAQLINDAAGHLLEIINDILDISKMQSGRYTLDSMEIDLKEVLLKCIASVKETADESRITIKTRIDGDLQFVRGDVAKLEQVFANLIGNALKFTRPGGTVFIEAAKLNDGGSAVFVRDTGVGMSEEEINVALEPFGQVDGTRTRWREGTGLGLSIAKALVELHAGTLQIKSAKSMGTEVAVLLPSPELVSVISNRNRATMGSPQLDFRNQ